MAMQQLRFPPFRLDLTNNLLWREEYQIPLRPKSLAVLGLLVERRGQVVSKEALFHAVWPDTVVSEGVLKVCIREIREALGDNSGTPKFIETLPRQGYRFIAVVAHGQQTGVDSPHTQPTVGIVGRAAELEHLHGWLTQALSGQHQVVFITGEPGIGKTAIVDAFETTVRTTQLARIGHGQCVEHYGAGEAYLPVLEALEELCRTPAKEQIVTTLRQYAPLWLAQLPALLSPAEREQLQRGLQGATQERMLREMATALEALTAAMPVILVLEDLHWSDASTLTLLSAIARRRHPARLLLIGTYRPTDVSAQNHPLAAVTQELRSHRQCQELPLSLLREEDVSAYLATRFAKQSVPQGLAQAIYQHTEGNPLFMVNLVDQVFVQGEAPSSLPSHEPFGAVLRPMPENLRQMITYQIDRLGQDEQRILEVASVAGMEFSAAIVAAALDTDVFHVEQCCNVLTQRCLFLASSASFPEQRQTSRYEFRHSLFHNVFYERLGLARRRLLHQRVGEQKEAVYGPRAHEVAAVLAVHFIEGGDAPRAVQYLQQAAKTALRRSAHQEAKLHLTRALDWLPVLPETTERTQRELDVHLMLGVTLMSTQGFAAPQVQQTYAHAHRLCQQLGQTPQLFPALWGLRSFYHVRAEYHTAREIAEQLLQLAQTTQNTDLLVEGHLALGVTYFFLGEVLDARTHLEESLRWYDPLQHRTHAYMYGQDPAVLALCHLAPLLFGIGFPDQAATRIQQAVVRAEEMAHPFSLGYAHCFAAAVHQGRRDPAVVMRHTQEATTLAQTQGFPHFLIMSSLLHGWALAALGKREEGLQQLQQALEGQIRIGFDVGRSYYLTQLAEVHASLGQSEQGLQATEEGLERVAQKNEGFFAAELYRLKGELMLQQLSVAGGQLLVTNPKAGAEAEACFHKAIEIARRQHTKLFELRAVMSLSRLWQQQGKKQPARQGLADLYGWFTEGFETPDLQEAKALLEELS